MKTFGLALSIVFLLFRSVNGHYQFQQIAAAGVKGAIFQHVRRSTNNNMPLTDITSFDLRCNAGGMNGSETSTLEVAAGSTVTYSADVKVYHQGPVSFYMTKVENAKQADGSTEWFKIKDIGPSFTKPGGDWSGTQEQDFAVQLPGCIPSGEYLLRIQHMALHNPGGGPQFHVSCAQLKVKDGGSTPPPADALVRIPGLLAKTDIGYRVNIYNDFQSYDVPGPAVWACPKM